MMNWKDLEGAIIDRHFQLDRLRKIKGLLHTEFPG
jgi:hypothetical protein